MSKNSENNKRIAKNTLMLYFRMFITTIVGLYTSRVVLNTLGVTDFGIYNVVGGIITMASFFNSAMVAASQRFLSFELGRNDYDRLKRVFCTTINIHATICLVALVLAETIGLWFVNAKLVIPEDRMIAANWVYQASILTFIIKVMSVPYNSAIVAHEKMSAFAYISILDVVLQLLIVYLLVVFPFDKLIVYSILMVCVVSLIRVCYTIYCKRHFSECTYHFFFDKPLFFEIFSFAGWSIIGNLGFSFKNQLSNIILNLFFGPSVNAARGVAMQVSSHVKTFAHSFTMALNPQITKQYAAGNLEVSRILVYAGSRYTFYLLTLISIPVIININYILKLWLGVVPEFTAQFVIFTILTSLLYALSECVTKAIQATGRIKWFQIGVSIIMLSELPIAWVLLEMGYPPYAAMWPSLLTYSVALFFRFWLINRYVEGYRFMEYFIHVVLRCIVVFVLSYGLSHVMSMSLHPTFLGFIESTILCVIVSTVVIILLGMEKGERNFVINKVRSIVNKRLHS
ncbi:MAG: oligosaccharide flippase family protein [Prevotella sp.]|nr:oligosaccharide flippase family protein [Prevotella sp.]